MEISSGKELNRQKHFHRIESGGLLNFEASLTTASTKRSLTDRNRSRYISCVQSAIHYFPAIIWRRLKAPLNFPRRMVIGVPHAEWQLLKATLPIFSAYATITRVVTR
jgi:hypothetical protein